MERRYLFRKDADQEGNQCGNHQQGAHDGESMKVIKGVAIITYAQKEQSGRNRQEEAHRRKQCAYFEYDDEIARAFSKQLYMALAFTHCGPDWDIGHRITSSEKGHGAGRWIGKTVR